MRNLDCTVTGKNTVCFNLENIKINTKPPFSLSDFPWATNRIFPFCSFKLGPHHLLMAWLHFIGIVSYFLRELPLENISPISGC